MESVRHSLIPPDLPIQERSSYQPDVRYGIIVLIAFPVAIIGKWAMPCTSSVLIV